MTYIRPSYVALAILSGTLLAEPASAWTPMAPSVPSVSVRPPSINIPSVNPNINTNIRDSGGGGGGGGYSGGGGGGGYSGGGGGGGYSGGGGGGGGGDVSIVYDDDPGDGDKAAGSDLAAANVMDPCGCGPDMAPAANDSSVGASSPTTSSGWLSGDDGLRQYRDELEAEAEKLNNNLAAADAKVAGLMEVFKQEQRDDKLFLGDPTNPNSSPGKIDYIPTFSGWTSPTVEPLNNAIDARNGVVALIKMNQQALSMVRAALYGGK